MTKTTTVKFYLVFAVAITFFSLLPVVRNGFVNWDDNLYVYDNPSIRTFSCAQVKSFFTSFYPANYHPLVFVSYSVEYQLFNLNPRPYHITNFILHLANCALVFWLIYLVTGGNPIVSFCTAVLFGIHPLHVEPVAWISGRKDVLYAFFYLAAAIAYVRSRNPGNGLGGRYWLSLFLFLCSLLSKSMAVTLPAVLLLIDWYSGREKLSGAVVRLAPFFVLSAVFSVLAVLAQHSFKAFRQDQIFNLADNIMNAAKGLVFYLARTFVPAGLSCCYPPLDEIGGFISYVVAAAVPVLVLVVIVLWFSAGHSRKPLFGGMFFLITILPVLQLVPIGPAVPADRYTYLPLIGIFYIAAEGIGYLLSAGARYRLMVKVMLGIVVMALAVISWNRAAVWKDSHSLWNNVIKNYDGISTAYLNRGIAYRNLGDYDRAMADYDRTIELYGNSADAYNNRANIYFIQKQYEKALLDYSLAISVLKRDAMLDRNLAGIYNNRAYCYYALGDKTSAQADIKSARRLGLKPDPAFVELIFR